LPRFRTPLHTCYPDTWLKLRKVIDRTSTLLCRAVFVTPILRQRKGRPRFITQCNKGKAGFQLQQWSTTSARPWVCVCVGRPGGFWLHMGGCAWRAAARSACIHRAACADCGRLRRVSATAARAMAMRVGIDAMRLLAECGQFPMRTGAGRGTCKRCGSDSIMCAVCVRIARRA
jgi:hypothetical protein